jgi:hypothetical protein
MIAYLEKLQLQNKALQEEIQEKDRKIKSIEEETFKGWILTKGLPALGPGPRDTTASVSQKKNLEFTLENSCEFGCLAELEKEDLKLFNASAVWKRQKMDYIWVNEDTIKFWVKSVMDDCIECIPELYKMIHCPSEKSFPRLENRKWNVHDLTLFTKRAVSSAVGVVEVKKPPNETQASQGVDLDFDKPDQIIQYMHDLRASCGVRFVLGIFTNYEKWCFYWFKDSDLAVKETTLDGYLQMCSTSPD